MALRYFTRTGGAQSTYSMINRITGDTRILANKDQLRSERPRKVDQKPSSKTIEKDEKDEYVFKLMGHTLKTTTTMMMMMHRWDVCRDEWARSESSVAVRG
ncbi:hypothetical protein KIN20_033143 [Parelaphostrongylus tenuis]|uniref:Uncharacterized protein n=1 Tax=Parelaphostrongylus tenuis TaxID=148309 RepID=A0AAD5R7I7_PARTN|nr:hypothetical protein KIN20_033143 [Parelaphostrongylus tenuis]